MIDQILKAIKKTSNTQQKKYYFLQIPKITKYIEYHLKNLNYVPGIFSCFVVKDPKIREIFAPNYIDRVVHHLVVGEIIDEIDKKFIYDNYANRKNRGVLFGVNRIQKFIKNKSNVYYIQMDIKSFFTSINKKILWELLKKHIDDIEDMHSAKKYIIKYALYKIITQNILKPYAIFTGNKHLLKDVPKEKSLFYAHKLYGLPIGSLTSQFFANVYLNPLDQFVKHHLKVKSYGRYVDDFIIFGNSKKELLGYQVEIENFLKNKLDLSIHPKKTILDTSSNGVDFLGFIIKKDYKLIRQRSIKALKKKLYFFNHLLNPKDFPFISIPQNSKIGKDFKAGYLKAPIEVNLGILQKMLAVINSYYGFFSKGDSFYLRKSLYEKHFHELKKYFVAKNKDFKSIKIRSKYK